ncbi:MAG: hypothetical protein OEY80_06020 [Nitrospirota bacterium]|jgi:hypothetical protein|nr:hypothetical protein [Nitrospirota bacterium]
MESPTLQMADEQTRLLMPLTLIQENVMMVVTVWLLFFGDLGKVSRCFVS